MVGTYLTGRIAFGDGLGEVDKATFTEGHKLLTPFPSGNRRDKDHLEWMIFRQLVTRVDIRAIAEVHTGRLIKFRHGLNSSRPVIR